MKKHTYLITSERADRRWDETEVTFHSDNVYNVGQTLMLDGLRWTVVAVVR